MSKLQPNAGLTFSRDRYLCFSVYLSVSPIKFRSHNIIERVSREIIVRSMLARSGSAYGQETTK